MKNMNRRQAASVVVLFLSLTLQAAEESSNDLSQNAGLSWTTATVTKTIGPKQDFETLKEALDWSSQRVFINGGYLTLSLVAGTHKLDCYDYRNMNARNVFITGPPLRGPMPLASDMTGAKEHDIALIASRFAARIEIAGTESYGLALPYGIGGIDNLAVMNPDTYGNGPKRYTLSCGLQSSWETSEVGASIRLGNVAVVGGVWGINAVGCRVVNKNALFFAYQYNGGPVHLSSNSQYRHSFAPAKHFQAYVPDAQYGVICHDSSAWLDNTCTIKGARIAFVANGGGARIDAAGAEVVNCQVVAASESGGVINIPGHVAFDCDASPGTAAVELWKGMAIGRRAVYFAGANSFLNVHGGQIKGAVGTYGFYAVAGGRIFGTSVTMDDFFFKVHPFGALAYADSASEIVLGIAATHPRTDSGNTMVADNGGRIYAQGSTGVAYQPGESGVMDHEGSLVVQ